MVQGRDRRLELGYQLAIQCRKKLVYPLKNKNSKFNNGGQGAGGGSGVGAPGSVAGVGGAGGAGGAGDCADDGSISGHNAVKASA